MVHCCGMRTFGAAAAGAQAEAASVVAEEIARRKKCDALMTKLAVAVGGLEVTKSD